MISLYPYQVASADALEAALRKHRTGTDLSDTGTGKSFVGAEVARRLGCPVGVVAPKAVIPSWKRILNLFEVEPLFVLNYEKLKMGKTGFGFFTGKHFHWKVPEDTLLIWDECFPEGTKVSTPKGDVNIESVRVGDYVSTPNGNKRVLRKVTTHKPKATITIKHEQGTITCTPNHKLWNGERFVRADAFRIGDSMSLGANNNVLSLWCGVSSKKEQESCSILFEELCFKGYVEEPETSGSYFGADAGSDAERFPAKKVRARQNDEQEPGERPRSQGENRGGAVVETTGESIPSKERGERGRTNRTSKSVVERSRCGMGPRTQSNWGREGISHSWMAHNVGGHSFTKSYDRSRGRRRESHGSTEEGQGQQKRQDSGVVGVDCGSVEEQNREQRLRILCSGNPTTRVVDIATGPIVDVTYNLEVEDLHCYYADGVLVSNCHRVKGESSQNSKMAKAAKHLRNLLISATLAEDPIDMNASGYLLGLHNGTDFYPWLRRMGCTRNPWGGMYFKRSERDRVLNEIHRAIIPEKGYRVRIKDLGDAFPETLITAEAYDMDAAKEINAAYKEMEAEIAELAKKCDPSTLSANVLTTRLRARQKVELLKVPALVKMAQDLVAEGNSVVLFTSFHDTLLALCERLKTKCAVHGQQTAEERQACVDAFQADKQRVIVVNVQAGGVGLSLHDINGDYPRVALLTPVDSAILLKQALGRVHRAGGKSKSIQRLVFASGTIEEKVAKAVEKKLLNIEKLNDADLAVSESLFMRDSSTCINTNNIEPEKHSGCTPNTEPTCCEKSSVPESTKESSCAAVQETSTSKPSNPGKTTSGAPSAKRKGPSPSAATNKVDCIGWEPDQSGDKSFADRGKLGHKAYEEENPELCGEDTELKEAVKNCLVYSTRINAHKVHREFPISIPILNRQGYLDRLHLLENAAHIFDPKFSKTKYKANSVQFWAYCVGVWNLFPEVEEITVHVLMPFLNKIDVETFTRAEDYDRLVGYLISIVTVNESASWEQFRIHSGCTWCGRRGRCPKVAAEYSYIAATYAKNPELQIPECEFHGSEITDGETLRKLHSLAPIMDAATSGWKKATLDFYMENGMDGFELVHRNGTRKCTNAAVAWDIVKDHGVSPEEFAAIADVPIGKLEDLIASKAKVGGKAAAKQELEDKLRDREALQVTSGTCFLKQTKQ